MYKNRLFAALAVAAFCLLAGAAVAQKETKSGESGNDAEAIDLLRQIEQRYGAINSVTGRFKQTKTSPAEFEEPTITSQASFYMLKPSKFRADYDPPKKTVNLINGDYSYQYVEEIKQLNRYKFKGKMTPRDLNYLLLGFGANTNELTAVYTVKWLTRGVPGGYHGIQLVPKDKKTANFKYITILVTKDDALRPIQFSMEQHDGVRVTVDLDPSQLKIGGRIPNNIFEPRFPVEPTDIE